MKIQATNREHREQHCWAAGRPGQPCWGDLLVDMIGYTDEGDELWIDMCWGHRETWSTDKYIQEPGPTESEGQK